MTEGKVYCSGQSTTPPEWYWVRGLHDACIIGVEPHEYPIDYSKYSKKINVWFVPADDPQL